MALKKRLALGGAAFLALLALVALWIRMGGGSSFSAPRELLGESTPEDARRATRVAAPRGERPLVPSGEDRAGLPAMAARSPEVGRPPVPANGVETVVDLEAEVEGAGKPRPREEAGARMRDPGQARSERELVERARLHLESIFRAEGPGPDGMPLPGGESFDVALEPTGVHRRGPLTV